MATKPIIAVDVDDTVAWLMPEWIRLFNQTYGRSITHEMMTDWEATCIAPEDKDNFYGLLHSQALYDGVLPREGALDGTRLLRLFHGYRVVYVTSAVAGHAGAKLRWLRKHNFLTEKHVEPNYVECYDKALIKADLLIDDKPGTAASWPGPVIMPETPNNRRWQPPANSRIFRVQHWDQIPELVRGILR